jgi:hypothetical protein
LSTIGAVTVVVASISLVCVWDLICGCDLLMGCVALLRVKSGSMLIRWLLARFLTGAAAVVLRWWFVCHRRRNCCVRCCCWLSFGTDSVGSLRCSLQTVALLLHCLDLWFFQICWDLQFSWAGADSLLSFLVTYGLPSRPFRSCPVLFSSDFGRLWGLGFFGSKEPFILDVLCHRGCGTWICPCWRSFHSPFLPW